MRTPFMLLLVVLLAADVARANMAPLGFKEIPKEIHAQFAEPHPGFTFFVVSRDRVEWLPSPEGDVNLSHLVSGSYFGRRSAFRLCAVPNDLLVEFGDDRPDRKWFEANLHSPNLRWAVFDPACDEVSMADPRERIVQSYRVTLTPTAIQAELLSERMEWSWSMVAVMGFLSLALAFGGIWLVRRLRRQPVTRPVPPPGN